MNSETGADATTTRGPRYWGPLLLVGAIGGTLSGLFGIGGGIVMVPLLVLLVNMDQRRASATSLAAILPTAVVGAISYGVNGEVDVRSAVFIAIGGFVGAFLGARLLRRLPLAALRWMFVGMLLLVAVSMIVSTPERGAEVGFGWGVALGLIALGLVMGLAAGLFGVGGGVIVVPSLIVLFGAGDLIAKGTSLLVMVPTALSGTATNVRGSLVHIPSALVMGVTAVLCSVPGVALAFLISPAVGTYLFAGVLLFAAVQLAIKAMRAR